MRNSSEAMRQLLLPVLSAVGAIGVLALAVYWIRSWWRENAGGAESDHVLLSEYREMHQRGELSEEEYRLIKSQYAPRMGKTSPPLSPPNPNDQAKSTVEKEYNERRD